MFSALWAIYLESVSDLHKVLKARIIIGEPLEEICNRELLSQCLAS
jgi:hypothetical protein